MRKYFVIAVAIIVSVITSGCKSGIDQEKFSSLYRAAIAAKTLNYYDSDETILRAASDLSLEAEVANGLAKSYREQYFVLALSGAASSMKISAYQRLNPDDGLDGGDRWAEALKDIERARACYEDGNCEFTAGQ